MDIQKLQRLVIDALEDVKAQDIKVFNTSHITSLFDRVVIAISRLGPDAGPVVRDAMTEIQRGWLDAVIEQIGDVPEARAVILMGDGLYYNAALAGAIGTVDDAAVAELRQVVQGLVASALDRRN